MRIAVFSTYFAPEVNGLTRYIEGLYGALLRKHPDISVDVFTFDTKNTGVFKEEIGPFTVYRAECVTILDGVYALPTVKGYGRLRQVFNSRVYDVVNTHTRFFVSTFIGTMLARKKGIPLVHTEHGSGFVEHENVLVCLIAFCYDVTFGIYSLRCADVVCVVSESVAQFIRRFGIKRIMTVSNGIDFSFWHENARKESSRAIYGVKDGETCIVFAGRLIAAKGCQDLLFVLRSIDDYSWRLLIAGDGSYRKSLERLSNRLDVSQKVLFLGALSKEKMRELFRTADVFVNPSKAAEGLPTTLLEASAAGCPCISSDAGGSKDVLPKACLYEAGDVEGLRALLKRYRTLPRVDVSRFSWDSTSEVFLHIVEATR